MISILCPTRNRPLILTNMVKSVAATVEDLTRVEVLFYVDLDDDVSIPAIKELSPGFRVDYKVGPRITLTQCWNELLPLANGEYVMQGNDDVMFRTHAWDRMVHEAFDRVPDKILMVHGSDEGQHFERFGAHPIVSRKWVDAVGYFIPPYFSSDFGDKWVNDLANSIKRRVYLPFVAEHMHFMFGKAQKDQTTLDRLDRHERDNVNQKWNDTFNERQQAVNILMNLINGRGFTKEEVKAFEVLAK